MVTISLRLKVLLFWPFVTYAKEHQRCLRHIDELERDLFPEWFPMPGWGKAEIETIFPKDTISPKFPTEPGAIIRIPANYQQIFRNFYPCASSANSNARLVQNKSLAEWYDKKMVAQ